MSKLCAEGTRFLASMIERNVLVPIKKDRIIELFTVNGEARCTCTSCGDGDRIGRILDRLYNVADGRKAHLFTENGGPLAHCDDSPLLVIDGWSNETVHRSFRQIEKAQQKLDKGRSHAAITHFPCGAAAEVGFDEFTQLRMFAKAICFKKQHLNVEHEHLLALVHIEWSKCSLDVLVDEYPHLLKDRILDNFEECLLVFKRTAWTEYCLSRGIAPDLDVHEYNLVRFGKAVSAAPVTDASFRHTMNNQAEQACA